MTRPVTPASQTVTGSSPAARGAPRLELFVTGTDTGVGKTTVALALLAAAARRGRVTAALKPAESGCARDRDGVLVPSDAIALSAAASVTASLDTVCPYRFADAVAPGLAAERTGQPIDFAVVERCLHTVRALEPDLVLVEGAGGLLVPLGAGRSIRDLARTLGLPLLVVARASLGTINHTLLTIEAARRVGLTVAGVILSASGPPTAALEVSANARAIADLAKVAVFGCLSRVTEGGLGALADAAEQDLDLAALDAIFA